MDRQDWYLMKPNTFMSGEEKDEFYAYTTDGFIELLKSPLGKHVKLCKGSYDIKENVFEIENDGVVIFQNISSDTALKNQDRYCLTIQGTLQDYEYVKFNDDVYLIVSEPSFNEIYDKAVLKICTSKLRYKDKVSDSIYNIPFWSEDSTKYSNGVLTGKEDVVFQKQYNIKIPKNDLTMKLKNDMRFILEMMDDIPLVYKLTKYDGISENNTHIKILNIVLTQDVYNPTTDNKEEMLADYISDNRKSYKIKYVGNPEVRIGYSKSFTIDDALDNCEWILDNTDIASLEIENNTAIVSASPDNKNIGETIVLECLQDSDVIDSVQILLIGGI